MRALYKNANFVLLWGAQSLSRLAETLFSAGLMVTVFQQTGSAVQTAAVMLANLLPLFVLSRVAGVLVDRLSKKSVLVGAIAIHGLAVLGLWWAVSGVSLPLFWIYVVKVLMASASAFYEPARLAVLPSLVARGLLVRANSLIIGTNQTALALGYIVGGFLALYLDLGAFTLIVIAVYAMALALLAPLCAEPQRRLTDAITHEPFWKSFRDGLSVVRRNPVARPLIVMETLENLPHGMWTPALMLVFVDQALGGASSDWGYQNGAVFVGQMAGALAATVAARAVARWAGWAIVGNTFVNATLTVLYALSPNNLIAVAVSFLFGPPFAVRDVAQDSLLQTSVDKSLLGRLYALRDMLRNAVFMLAGMGFAALADVMSVRWIYLLGAGLYGLTALYALTNRTLRHSRIET